MTRSKLLSVITRPCHDLEGRHAGRVQANDKRASARHLWPVRSPVGVSGLGGAMTAVEPRSPCFAGPGHDTQAVEISFEEYENLRSKVLFGIAESPDLSSQIMAIELSEEDTQREDSPAPGSPTFLALRSPTMRSGLPGTGSPIGAAGLSIRLQRLASSPKKNGSHLNVEASSPDPPRV